MSVNIAPPPQNRSTGLNAGGTAPGQTRDALEAARGAVQRLLTAIPTFPDLSDEERSRMAKATVQVLSFMADPNGVYSEVADREARGELPKGTLPAEMATPRSAPARALEDAVEQTKQALASSPGFAGKDFEAGAVKQGVQQFGEMVQKVDFPKFVGGLIKNVFQAIVESSIDQMRAYGELIANVAKTTDQFMRDNIGEAAGRDFLVDSYPDVFQIDTGSTSDSFEGTETAETAPPPRLATVSDDAAVRIAEISRNLNLNPPVTDISDANAELRLVTAARLQMAKSRQQLLSSMVMLGINRIVVTDGSINAKVIFDMRSSDKAKRQYTASMNDRSATALKNTAKMEYGSWFSPVSAEMTNEFSTEHVATVASAVDETSESKAEAKAKLSGEVRVNFKSDYLPLDKMATPGMMSVIQGNSTPFNPNQPEGGAAGTRAG
ncbi:hypothetical protein ACFSAG_07535 [Sphingorhabdus buctiana]|jgi:hypothetical protein|uniref:Uncharacterized protein n=1 Tax=Sphingorhabdus buctiana TaxID=1508805 RepID=A0ABW4MEC9_9SPHN